MTTENLVSFLLPAVAATASAQTEAYREFTVFLTSKMREYESWIKANNLDPSPPILDTIVLPLREELYANIACNIRFQVTQGHSNTADGYIEARSRFLDHQVNVIRDVYSPYEFSGKYQCEGMINSSFFPELTTDLPFVGYGQYEARLGASTEILKLSNLGISEEYKSIQAFTWTVSGIPLRFSNTLKKYKALLPVYTLRFLESDDAENQQRNPSRQLLLRYTEKF